MQDIAATFLRLPSISITTPEIATQAMQMEEELLYAGLTIVFSNRVSQPRQKGMSYTMESVSLLLEYGESGEFLNKLSGRVIDCQRQLAQNGNWTGGRPPYGFVRARVDAQGNLLEELTDGKSVRQQGTHTRIMPKDREKIAVWLKILELYHQQGWGSKRIAAWLNERGIPSPDAGRVRHDRGIAHVVSGKWSHPTVAT